MGKTKCPDRAQVLPVCGEGDARRELGSNSNVGKFGESSESRAALIGHLGQQVV